MMRKNKIIILIILIATFFCGCFLNNKQITKNHLPTNPKFDIKDDSLTITFNNIEKYNLNKNVLEKSLTVIEHYNGIDYPPDLKITERNSTKIFKQSNNLSEGRLIYKIPNTMRIRSTYKVLVRISKSKANISIFDSLSGDVITSRIPVTETMEVQLIDISPKDKKMFDIVEDNNAVQIIDDDDSYTEWSWNVTPIRVGVSKLKVVISIIRNNNKKDIVYEDIVEIERDLKEQIIFFLEEYWKWIITTFLIPIFIWWWKNKKNKKSKDSENGNEEK